LKLVSALDDELSDHISQMLNHFEVITKDENLRTHFNHSMRMMINSGKMSSMDVFGYFGGEMDHSFPSPHFGQQMLHHMHEYNETEAKVLNAERMKGNTKPKYFAPRSGSSIAGELLGVSQIEARRFGKYAGLVAAAAGAATFFMPGQTEWILGGDSQGRGGEQYDFWSPNYGLPSDVPLDIPEYHFDSSIRMTKYSDMFKRKREQVIFETLANNITPSMESLWNQPAAEPIKINYRDRRFKPITTDSMRNQQIILEGFRR
jgi:hypothetical protein